MPTAILQRQRLQLAGSTPARPSTTAPASSGCSPVARGANRRWCAPCSPRIRAAAPSCARSAPRRRWRRSRSSSRSAPPWRPSPRRRAREEGPQGRLHPHHLRHAHHHGAPDGLLHQARAQRGGGEDRRLGGHPRQDPQQGIRRGAHALADAAGHHAGRRLQRRSPTPCRRWRTSTARPSRSPSSTRTSATRRTGRASSSRCRSTTRCTTICCATTWPSTASIPTPTSRSAPSRRRRWWPTCAPTTSTASSAPDPVNQRAVYDGVGFIHMLSKDIWDRHPCCAFAASKEFVTQTPNTYAALLKAIIDATAFAAKPENRKQIAEAIAPANYLNQPVTVRGAGADRHLRRRPRQRADGARPHRFRSVPLAVVRGVDHDPDEALGADQGRRRLRRRRPAGVPRHRHGQADEGGGPHAAGRHHARPSS